MNPSLSAKYKHLVTNRNLMITPAGGKTVVRALRTIHSPRTNANVLSPIVPVGLL